MAETWPANVPSLAMIGSMKGKPFRAPIVTDMEDGPSRKRRSTTKNIATYTFAITMTNAQFATFKAWVRNQLVDGTLPFSASVYTGSGAATKTCSFTQPYDDDPTDGTQHVVSVSLDIEDY